MIKPEGWQPMFELDSQAQEGGPHSLRGWGSQFYAAFSAGNGGEEWIMMVLWRWGSRCLPAGPSAQTEASRVPFAAMVDYSPLFGSFSVGDRVSLVASLVTFDDGGTNHLMSSVISKKLVPFSGWDPAGQVDV